MKYGLIGERLGHSFSKDVHAMLADYSYELCEIAKDELGDFMKKADFSAINVTIPYKEAVIPYLSYVSEEAKRIGAVNTVLKRDGKLYGYNTDFFGMSAQINKMRLNLKGKKTVILGTGGTSKTAQAVAESMGAYPILVVSRTKRDGVIDYEELTSEHLDAQIIINTTPVGMYPDNDSCPIDVTLFKSLVGVIDAIYNPIRTKLVLDALSMGARAEGGLYMLVAQAVYASEIFLGVKHPKEKLEKIFKKIRRKKENIVLIGMPSSGKSTVGKILAEKVGEEFIDTDELITEKIKMPIKDFFALYGEEKFREVETEVIREIAGRGGLVIATGGGAVLRKENIFNLRYNGNILFIDRPLNMLIPTDSRPLSSDRMALENLYMTRYPIYSEACDSRIEALGTPLEVADNILENYL